jgi:hypothetical protein
MKRQEQQNAFYRPLWRRIAIVCFVALWLAFELVYVRDGLWTAVAAGFLAYAAWTFLINWPKTPDKPPQA